MKIPKLLEGGWRFYYDESTQFLSAKHEFYKGRFDICEIKPSIHFDHKVVGQLLAGALNSVSEDQETLATWARSIFDRMFSKKYGGCADVAEDGKGWRHSFPPKGLFSMRFKEAEALMRFFGLPKLYPIISRGQCGDCLHGYGVRPATVLWPVIKDCNNCDYPAHPHFIPHTDLEEFAGIRKKDVFEIPFGAHIPSFIERLKEGKEGSWEYHSGPGKYVYRVKDGRRICHIDSLGQLGLPGNERGHRLWK